MNEGIYYSRKLKTRVSVYKPIYGAVCMECGKFCTHPIAFVKHDDPDGLEYIYGGDCIKNFKLELIARRIK